MANTTVSLANEVQVYYHKKFLENLKKDLIFKTFTREYDIPKMMGPSIYFTRYTRINGSATANQLSEGVTPAGTDLSDSRVSATVTQHGDFTTVTDLLLNVQIQGANQFIENAVDEMSYSARDTIDLLTRNAFNAGTNVSFVGAAAALSDVAGSTSIMTAADIRKMVRTLRKRDVLTWDGQHYAWIIAPGQQYDLLSETTTGAWLDANKYTTMENIVKGEIGRLYGVRFWVNTNLSSISQSGTVSETYAFGKDAVGSVNLTDLSKASRKQNNISLYIKHPDDSTTSDPLNQRVTVGWKLQYAAVVLDDARLQKYVVGETA